MNINNLVVTAFRALERNKMRSALSCIGIIIGVSSVILMVGLGSSARLVIKQKIYSYGVNGLSVHVKPRQLTTNDIIALKKTIPQIKYISPVQFKNKSLTKAGSMQMYSRLFGVNNEYFKISGRDMASGRIFTDLEIMSNAKVAVIGLTNKEILFGNDDAVGTQILIENTPFKVIGVLQTSGEALSGTDFDNVLIIPFTTANTRIWHTPYFDEVYISAESGDMVESVHEEVRSFLRRKYNIPDRQEDGFTINTSQEKLKTASYISNALLILLAGIASISLVVGGIGIMNIMLASITERTREIGIRMAVGAKKRDILAQFLIESLALTSIGGIIGIAFGLFMYYIITTLVSWPFVFSLSSIMVSVLFSSAVGIFFGFYPSRKAAGLKPIEALKFE